MLGTALLNPPPAERRSRGWLGAAVLAGHGLVMAWALQGGGGVDARRAPPEAPAQPALLYLSLPSTRSDVAEHPAPARRVATVPERSAPPSLPPAPAPNLRTAPGPLAWASPPQQQTVPASHPAPATPHTSDDTTRLMSPPDSQAASAGMQLASTAPRALAGNALPAYPEAAREDGLHGSVQLLLQIDAQGRVQSVQWLRRSGVMLLDLAARDALQHWRFEPARVGTQAVPSSTTLTVRFQLDAPVTATALAAR